MKKIMSDMWEPPKPLFIMGTFGKYSAVDHLRMLELPTKRTSS